jgi:RimJ/RimL family protein N-acetyltransferase
MADDLAPPALETDRLILRRPVIEDFEAWCAMMGDEETARFIGGVQAPPHVWRSLCTLLGHWQVRGYSFFTVLDKSSSEFIGRVGPWYPQVWPQPEIGWTVKREAWGKGYAVEAAAACMDHVFETLGWSDVIHLIDKQNTPSASVAAKLGSRNSGREDEVAGFGVLADVWGQTAEDWRARKA